MDGQDLIINILAGEMIVCGCVMLLAIFRGTLYGGTEKWDRIGDRAWHWFILLSVLMVLTLIIEWLTT